MRKYSKILLITISIISILSIDYFSDAIAEDIKLSFRVNVSGLFLQSSNTLIKDKNQDDIIEILLPGKLYDPNIEITLVSKDAIDLSTPETAEKSFYSSNRNGDPEWIIENWVEEDQNSIQNSIKEFLPQNTALFQSIEQSYITGRAKYNDYIMLFIKNTYSDAKESHIIHTYKKTAEGWKATNALSADETYDVVFAALRSGQIMINEK